MDILNNKQKLIIIIIVIFMLLFIGYYIIKRTNNLEYIDLETEEDNLDNLVNPEENDNNKKEEESIIVHVIGAVENQGIIEIDNKSRISDVIEEAGGATEEADLSKINLAYMVQDGQKIYVPSINDEMSTEKITEGPGENIIEESDTLRFNQKVNINTANQTELETLNGIGPSTALKIINYRNQNGSFENIEDIKNVPGIGDSKFENIKDDICIK